MNEQAFVVFDGINYCGSCSHHCLQEVVFKDWHVSIHSFYLISDRIGEGHAIIDQRWSYEDFCDITVRLDDYTYALNRQVEAIALVRSFRSMPIDEFDRIAQPLIRQSV